MRYNPRNGPFLGLWEADWSAAHRIGPGVLRSARGAARTRSGRGEGHPGRVVKSDAYSALLRTASTSRLIVTFSLMTTAPATPGMAPLKLTPKSFLLISPAAEKPTRVPP